MRSTHFGIASCLLLLSVPAVCRGASQTPSSPVVKHPPGAYAHVNGAKLWHESEGKGPPLVLISGGPGAPHNVFHPWFSALAVHYRVIYFDAFGRGKSDRGRSPKEYTFDRDVKDLEGLRKALGFNKMAVLGFSYGGMVAQAYALKHPGRVGHLILADTLYSGEMCTHHVEKIHVKRVIRVEQRQQLRHKTRSTSIDECNDQVPARRTPILSLHSQSLMLKSLRNDILSSGQTPLQIAWKVVLH